MTRFLVHTSCFCAAAVALFLVALVQADGHTDARYLRFTTPPQRNLILGDSRAAMGLRPGAMNGLLGAELYNYSFTVRTSPYGPTYLRSIRAKVDTASLAASGRDGIFVVTVNPWSLAGPLPDPDDPARFPERELVLGRVREVSSSPNLEYLFEELRGEYYRALSPEWDFELHDDGWLEYGFEMTPAVVAKREAKKLAEYRAGPRMTRAPSRAREAALAETIDWLDGYGDVYLVRLPTGVEMRALDEAFDPDFDERMRALGERVGGYLDLGSRAGEFEYADGNHLWRESAEEVSIAVAEWIAARRG